jgi:hypothetical protein
MKIECNKIIKKSYLVFHAFCFFPLLHQRIVNLHIRPAHNTTYKIKQGQTRRRTIQASGKHRENKEIQRDNEIKIERAKDIDKEIERG